MIVKCIVVDDEPLARKAIKNLLRNFDSIEVVAESKNAIKAMEVLNSTHIDLMFMDIQMPQITGIDFLRNVDNPPDVIVTTAFRDYAVESFELNVIDYLVKPISLERMIKAINKFFQKHESALNLPVQTHSRNDFIYVSENKRTNKIYLADIIFLESQKEYVKIITTYSSITTKASLTSFEKSLPQDRFLRVHNSFIVSVDHIRSFSMTSIIISSGDKIPISRSYRNSAVAHLNPKK